MLCLETLLEDLKRILGSDASGRNKRVQFDPRPEVFEFSPWWRTAGDLSASIHLL